MKPGIVIFVIILMLISLEKVVAQENTTDMGTDWSLTENQPELANKFQLNEVKLLNTAVFSGEEVHQIVQEYLNQYVSLFDLRAIQELLTYAYVEAGYVNSIVVLESQKITQGVIYYKAIEGEVQLEIKGTQTLKEYLAARLKPFLGPPFNQNILLERLKILSQNQKLEEIAANLSQTGEIGRSILTVNVVEADSWQIRTTINNFENPLIGDNGVEVELLNQKIWHGDSFKFLYKETEGLQRFLAVYRHEFAPNDSSVQFAYQESDSEIVEGNLEPFDVKNEAFTASLSYNQYLIKTANRSLTIDFGLERRESRGTVLNRRLFSDPQLTVGRIGATYSEVIRGQVIFGSSTFSMGGSSEEIDPTFFSWKAQGQVIKALTDNLQLYGRLAIHLSPHRQPGGERCALGGKNGNVFIFGNTVRGYGTNFVSDDNCIAGTLELRYSLLQEKSTALQVLGFVDYGQVWGALEDILPRRTLLSIGVGLRFEWDSLRVGLDVGAPLNSVPPTDTNQLNEVTFSVEGVFKF
jgi:hemolysin activation/secretion protein